MDEKEFNFELNSQVVISASGESGVVRGRAEYVACEPSYLVLYQAADGRACENWWPQSTLLAR